METLRDKLQRLDMDHRTRGTVLLDAPCALPDSVIESLAQPNPLCMVCGAMVPPARKHGQIRKTCSRSCASRYATQFAPHVKTGSKRGSAVKAEAVRLRAEDPPVTYKEIGRRLGMSKNAALGVVRRAAPELVTSPRPVGRQNPSHHKTPKHKVRPRGEPLPSLAPEDAPTQALAPPAPDPPPTPRTCCWPIGEPRTKGFRFCEAPLREGSVYCPAHHRVAYVRGSS